MSMSLPTPSLHTARLRLRAFEDADAGICPRAGEARLRA